MSDSPTVIHVVARAGIPNQVDVPTPGPPGPVGAKWQVGTTTPAPNLGGIGDYYLRSNGDVYGPKTSSGWGSIVFALRQPVSTDPPQALAVEASAGTSLVPSPSDHRHPFPTAQQVGADPSGTAAAAIAAHLLAKDHLTPQQAAAAAPVQSVAGKSGSVTLSKSDVGLGSVDNTSDANKPVSTAQAAADTAVAQAAATDATSKAITAQAFAIQRGNHTGQQTASTISDFASAAAAAAPVQSVAIAVPTGWSATPANQLGNITITLALPAGSSLVSSGDRSTWNTASTERLRWDGGSTGLDATAGRQSLGLHPVAASGLYSSLGGLPDLTVYATSEAVSTALAGKADLVGGVIPSSQIPVIAVTQYLGAVSSQSAMLALSGERGDWCLRTDSPNNGQWILSGDNSALIGNWVQIPVPTVPVQSVNGQTGSITLGPGDVGAAPSVHGHSIDQVTGLVTALTGKADFMHGHEISAVSGLEAALNGKTSRKQAITYAIALGGFL